MHMNGAIMDHYCASLLSCKTTKSVMLQNAPLHSIQYTVYNIQCTTYSSKFHLVQHLQRCMFEIFTLHLNGICEPCGSRDTRDLVSNVNVHLQKLIRCKHASYHTCLLKMILPFLLPLYRDVGVDSFTVMLLPSGNKKNIISNLQSESFTLTQPNNYIVSVELSVHGVGRSNSILVSINKRFLQLWINIFLH